MDNEAAYAKLLHKPEGTFLLRENEKGDLRFTIRSNLRDGRSSKPKVGHIPIEKAEDGHGWIIGQNYYGSLAEMIKSQKEIESTFQLKREYQP